MPKQPLPSAPRKFDLKFLLVGDAGAGKTHFIATYTQGPVHFYMVDPGGEKTLYKLNQNRPAVSPLTIDIFSNRTQTYNDFWSQIQKDEKEGFFDEMASKQGLLVMPDSFTTLNDMAIREIASLNKRNLMSQADDKKFGFRQQDWGQLGRWMQTLVDVINDMPCAVAVPCHLYNDTDKDGSLIGRYPKVTGQLRYDIGKNFDEVYLLEQTSKMTTTLRFKPYNLFTAKTRTFAIPKLESADMNQIATAYLTGDDLSSKGGKTTHIEEATSTVKESKMLLPGK